MEELATEVVVPIVVANLTEDMLEKLNDFIPIIKFFVNSGEIVTVSGETFPSTD